MILKKYRLRRWHKSLKIGDAVRDCHNEPHTITGFMDMRYIRSTINDGKIEEMDYLAAFEDGSYCDIVTCLSPLDKLPLFARKNKDAPWIRRHNLSDSRPPTVVRSKRLPKV